MWGEQRRVRTGRVVTALPLAEAAGRRRPSLTASVQACRRRKNAGTRAPMRHMTRGGGGMGGRNDERTCGRDAGTRDRGNSEDRTTRKRKFPLNLSARLFFTSRTSRVAVGRDPTAPPPFSPPRERSKAVRGHGVKGRAHARCQTVEYGVFVHPLVLSSGARHGPRIARPHGVTVLKLELSASTTTQAPAAMGAEGLITQEELPAEPDSGSEGSSTPLCPPWRPAGARPRSSLSPR